MARTAHPAIVLWLRLWVGPLLGAAPVALFLAPTAALADPVSWATAQAAELTRQGNAHAAQGDRDAAARRFLEAIQFDGTYGPAYLALGGLHERSGDLRESERAYSMGIERVTGFAEGLRARARVRSRRGLRGDALLDLEAAAALRPDDRTTLRELASAYVATRALPAALAVMRRVAALAEAQGDERAFAEALITARALGALVADVDPVGSGKLGRGPVRRAIALYARRPASALAR